MAQENWQKYKLLKLLELLQQESDEEHPITTDELCNKLSDMGISCERRTLSKDIDVLNSLGYEIMWVWVGKKKGYYIEDRSFSVPELKILIDAVQAASFVTPKKTQELIEKIANLGGSNRASVLQRNMVSFNTRKHSNEAIYYNVNFLEDAIQQQKKATFRYFDLDIKCKKSYRREGRHYVVEPVALVFNEDNYYLVAYSEKYDNTANYRVDRMDAVEVVDEPISERALEFRSGVGEYTEQSIKMFSGHLENVVLEFNKSFVGAVYDRFGESTGMMMSGEDNCLATVSVQLSPTFWGWLFQFGGKMKIISPESAVDEYKKCVEALSDKGEKK